MNENLLAASFIAKGDSKLLYKMKKFGLLSDIFKADFKKLAGLRVSRDRIDGLEKLREGLDLEAFQDGLKSFGFKALCLEDEGYPSLLKEIYQPPLVLYSWGELSSQDDLAVAVVGTRKPTIYGLKHTRLICEGLVKNKVTVVSGMAIGLDSHAHKVSLETGGRTIAVIAGGLDVSMTGRQKILARRIVDSSSGAVVSEYPLGVSAQPYHFPIRNRIIAGLSRAVVVVEGDLGSGALISASQANENGRLVFAVPGSIDSTKSRAPHELLKKGSALLVESVEDILSELNVDYVGGGLKKVEASLELENEVLEVLNDSLGIEEIIVSTGNSASEIKATLNVMELKGLVRSVSGKWTKLS